MLTALNIVEKEHRNILTKMLSKLSRDKIVVDTKYAANIELRCVTYIKRREKVNYKRLDSVIKAQRNRLLCDEKTQLDRKLGYKRFCDDEYKIRLCTNIALELLRLCRKDSLSVALVDSDGDFSLYPKYLLKYCDSLCIVTNDIDHYRELSDEYLIDTGVAVVLSKDISAVKNCDIIIAPKTMELLRDIKETALVLTTKKPQGNTSCTVVYDYFAQLPKEYKNLSISFLDDTYIMSALYSLKMLYDLGCVVPQLCTTQNSVHTLSSLKNMMHKTA